MRYKKIPNRDFIILQQYDENAAKNSSQFNSLTDTTLALSKHNEINEIETFIWMEHSYQNY